MVYKRNTIILCFSILLIAYSSCTTFEQLKNDFTETLNKFKNPSNSSEITSPSNELSTAETQGKMQSIRFVNNPINAIDVSIYRTNLPEPIASKLSKSKPANSITNEYELNELVKSLKEVNTDQILQVKAIHDWVSLTIKYDVTSFLNNNIPDQSWQTVLQNEKSVCEGYANVLDKMLRSAGFSTLKISGYARGYGTSVLSKEDIQDANHAWNMVKIKDYWYQLDSTWDSGYLEGNIFHQQYSTAYFLIKPEWIIYTHFPSRTYWQLTEKPVSPNEFANMSYLTGNFFDYIIDGYQALEKKVVLHEPSQINLQIKSDFKLKAIIYDASGHETNYGFIQQQDKTSQIFLAPPKGIWLLRLFVAQLEKNDYKSIAEIVIDSDNTKQISFPLVYSNYETYKTRIVSPILKTFNSGNNEEFVMYIEDIAKAFIHIGGRSIEMVPCGENIYTLELTVPSSGTIDVFIQKSLSSNIQTGLFRIPIVP